MAQAKKTEIPYLHRFLPSRFFANCKSTTHYEGPGYLKRACTHDLEDIFKKYATERVDGELYMTAEGFVQKYLGLFDTPNHNRKSVKLLGGIIDTSKDGLISFPEFQAFEGYLCVPDALYKTAFQLFDTNGSGFVSFEEFVEILTHTELHRRIPFDLNGGFVKLYFGKDKKRKVTYMEFSQFLHDFHEEYAVEAFRQFDKEGTGFITPMDFLAIMKNIKSHLLTEAVADKLLSVATVNSHRISFPFFMAFNSLLNQMELMKKIYLQATENSRTTPITKEEFLHSAQMMSQVTPLEVDILYRINDQTGDRSGKVTYASLQKIAPEQYFRQVQRRIADVHLVESVEERGFLIQMLESAYRFTLGALAGAIGATSVYPIDLVKTRMQNQRTGSFIGELMYKSSWDCFRKVVRHEGLSGLYRGLVPQLMGVAPEKAIKLTVNDLVRDKLMDKDGNLSFMAEMIAGASAGASQVVFTNPLEIVKIRLQVAGEIQSHGKIGALGVVKELGLFGLYKGAKACFLRDVPFSAIYFPVYAHTKVKFQDDNGYNSPLSLLVSGAIAGVPAASLVTPADVIKTRLQVVARAGQTTYSGVFDAARKIMAEEGFSAFWKGAGARVMRSSPQFGVTLLTYEVLQRLFYVDFKGTRPSGSEAQVLSHGQISEQGLSQNKDHIGGFQVALPILTGIETKFGLSLPKYELQK